MAEGAAQATKPVPGAAGRAPAARQATGHALVARRTFSEPGLAVERSAGARSVRAMIRKASAAGSQFVPPVVAEVLAAPGEPLTQAVRAEMEYRFDHHFGDVRVHSDAAAERAASSLGAAAFTTGNHVAFAAGRYRPQTAEGRRLLAHELAHVVHASTATARAEGVAPENSSAECGARRVATEVTHGNLARDSLRDVLRNFGPLYAVHPQTIVTKGTQVSQGPVGRPDWAHGEQGPEIGEVTVRTGEEVEVGKARIPNLIALEYTGALSADSKWLQFVWFEIVADTPAGTARLSGSVPTSSGALPFTTDPAAPKWAVDNGGAATPFYEAAFLNIREATSTTIFDAPGGGSAAPLADAVFKAGVGATVVRFVGHFDTFLIQRDHAMYRVSYTATTAFTQVKGVTTAAAIGYSVLGTTGPAASLPANLRGLLHGQFPGYKTVQ